MSRSLDDVMREAFLAGWKARTFIQRPDLEYLREEAFKVFRARFAEQGDAAWRRREAQQQWIADAVWDASVEDEEGPRIRDLRD